MLEEAKEFFKKAIKQMKKFVDKERRPLESQVGNKVLLKPVTSGRRSVGREYRRA